VKIIINSSITKHLKSLCEYVLMVTDEWDMCAERLVSCLPHDGGNIFVQNVGIHLSHITVSYHRGP
jgi:hypothetical protein